ncbi:MAG: hypothetical protein RLZZ282_253 [Verrucomicrobiota bacterium]
MNRAFRDKPGGLVVDYLGLAGELTHGFNWNKWTGEMSNHESGMSN